MPIGFIGLIYLVFSTEENPDTQFVDEVEVGKRYEVALTTNSGLYRYRMGDVVEVVGFHERCPVIAFKYRYVIS